MKNFNNNNQIFSQAELPFYNNEELSVIAKVFVFGLIVISIIFSFPVFTHGAEIGERIPVQTTEKTASLDMEIENQATTTDNFVLKISTNPNGQSINAIGTSVNYSPKEFKATKLNFDNSFCDLFIDKTIDNITGHVSIMCGKPYPGVDKESTIAEISFTRINKTSKNITFDTGSLVLANDGFGTDVLGEINNLK